MKIYKVNPVDAHYQAEKFTPEARFLVEQLLTQIKDMEDDAKIRLRRVTPTYND